MILQLLLIVAALGGIIAYAGDVIGRKIGRKHLRLFGLRPKTTGLVVAVGSGILVALASVGIISVVARETLQNALRSQDMRRNLDKVRTDFAAVNTEYTATRKDLEDALAKQDALGKQLSGARSELKSQQTELVRTAQISAQLRIKADSLTEQSDKLQKERAQVVAQRDRVKAERDRIGLERDKINLERNKISEQLQKLNTDRQKLNEQIANKSKGLTELAKQSTDTINALNKNLKGLDTQRRELDAERKKLENKVAKLGTEVSGLGTERNKLQKELSGLQTDKQKLEARNKELNASIEPLKRQLGVLENTRQVFEGDVSELTRTKNDLENQNDQLRNEKVRLEQSLAERDDTLHSAQLALKEASAGNFIYRNGELVSQVVLPEDDTPGNKSRLQNIFRQITLSAEGRGLRRGTGNIKLGNTLDYWATRAANQSGPDVLMFRTSQNVARGGDMLLNGELIANRTIFVANQTVFSSEINGKGKTNDELQAALFDVLRSTVMTLRNKHVPLENIPQGVVTDIELNNALAKLKNLANATVEVVAKQDVTPAGPLVFSLNIK